LFHKATNAEQLREAQNNYRGGQAGVWALELEHLVEEGAFRIGNLLLLQ
jgi:hypothetical protein